jgi:hemolysin activation/secretion protein
VIVIPEETRTSGTGKVIVRVIEGKLEAIRIGTREDFKRGRLYRYIAWRLGVDEDEPLNVNKLLESLQLLQIAPLIESISATLLNGTEQGKNILEVSYNPASSFDLPISFNNGRSPSVGSIERGVAIEENNLLGLGDSIRIGYLNTDGSDRIDASYEIPFNPKNGSFRFDFTYSNNRVVESPFKDINNNGRYPDITSDYEAYDFTLRQPIIRSVKNQVFTEFALSLIGSWRHTQSFLFGEPFPLAINADVLGNTRVFALRFGQDFIRQTSQDIIALSSQVSWGLDAFGSTINEQISGVETIADSRFVSWRLQGQYVRQLAPETLFLVRTNLQLSDRPLLPIEQFSSGGLGSVLGYRQDLLLTDNGFFIGTEFRVPILRITKVRGVLQVVPFINYGLGWNTDTITPEQNNLASIGLGLLWQMDDYISARIDYGIPLIDVRGRTRTWQENGIYFTIRVNPF